MKDFLNIMKATGRYIDANWNRSFMTYTFVNGSYIEFFSADQESKVRGPRRNILYINECNNISFDTYHQLAIRTSGNIWLDFNPSNEFWAYEELSEDIDPDAEWLILTYKDNEALNENIVKEIEKARERAKTSAYWDNWWKVYGLGQLGSLEGVIFSNWKPIDKIPKEAGLVGMGLDFGYSNDPTAIVKVYKYDGQFILHEHCYQTGMVNADIAKQLDNRVPIWADSAEPKSIEEIHRLGINRIKPVVKGADSINYGIQLMLDQQFLVTSQSTNLIKELRAYCWDKDKNGKTLNKPIDKWNHCFVGDTKVETINGDICISDIKEGDLVLTPNGYKPVLKCFNNGMRPVYNYLIQLDTETVSLTCTPDHKIKTNAGWIKISELKSGMMVYHSRNIKGKNIPYIKEQSTFQGGEEGCTLLCGNQRMESSAQRDTMYTIRMGIDGITIRQTLKLKKLISTYRNMVKGGLKKNLNGLTSFIVRELRLLKFGIKAKKGYNGIEITQKNAILESMIYQKRNAIRVGKSLNQRQMELNSAPTIVSLNGEGTTGLTTKIGHALYAEKNSLSTNTANKEHAQGRAVRQVEQIGKGNQQVFDIMVDEEHCYFANGVLVHNCVDATRYWAMMHFSAKQSKFY